MTPTTVKYKETDIIGALWHQMGVVTQSPAICHVVDTSLVIDVRIALRNSTAKCHSNVLPIMTIMVEICGVCVVKYYLHLLRSIYSSRLIHLNS